MTSQPEQAPLFLRVHTRVVEKKKKRKMREFEPAFVEKWARYAMVFDCETTIDLRQDLTFLWWRFCELKNDEYVCQQEGRHAFPFGQTDTNNRKYVAGQ